MRIIAGVMSLLLFERLLIYQIDLNFREWIIFQTLIFTIIPILLMFYYKFDWADVGLSFGDFGTGLKLALFLLALAFPIMVYGATLEDFKLYYPIWPPARIHLSSFIFFELAVLVMMFNTEFYFRGLLLFTLKDWAENMNIGKWRVIVFQAILYMLVHIGKPALEVPYSFFVGIVFGWLALKTRSILPSFIAHWTSSVLFDILVLAL